MAGKTAAKGKASKKAAPAPEPEELELEEVEGDEEESSSTSKNGQEEVTYGASDLARDLAAKSGKKVTPRELRTLIRKMARDGSGRVTREITAGNRSRYNWSGPDDPEVKAIVAAFEGGELEADKQAKLAQLKEQKAKKQAEKKASKEKGEKAGKSGKGKGGKKSEPTPEASDDDELELDDDE